MTRLRALIARRRPPSAEVERLRALGRAVEQVRKDLGARQRLRDRGPR